MMKFAFAIVALVHLCYTYELNTTLNWEIIERLEELNKLYRGKKLNITTPHMRVPLNMSKHPFSCVSDFVRELNSLLGNVTISEEKEHILQELKANLLVLDPHQQTNPIRCSVKERKISSKPFSQHIYFLKTLNSKKK